MSVENIAIQRLHCQQIEHPRFHRPDEVLAWMGVVQGQDYAGAKWSLGLRLLECSAAQIEQAIATQSILRSWILRGTLHFVAPADIGWMLALVAPRIISGNARRYRELELDQATLARSTTLLVKTLQDGQQLTRTELFAMLEQNGISTQGQRGVYLLQRASLEGLIGQSVMRGSVSTFLALEGVLPAKRDLSRDEALAELARRYFTSRGPATLADFVWWSGLSSAEARAGLEAARSALLEEKIGGQIYWLAPSKANAGADLPTGYLLPGFDEYFLSYKDRSASLDAQHVRKITTGGGMFRSTLVIDGQVVGVWKRTFQKGAVVVAAELFRPLSATEEEAFAAAAQRYAEFLELPLVMA
jgi:hypothetical protein